MNSLETAYDMIVRRYNNPEKYPDDFEPILHRVSSHLPEQKFPSLTKDEFSGICEAHVRKTVEFTLNNMLSYRAIAKKYVNSDGSTSSEDAIVEAIYKFAEDIKANASLTKLPAPKGESK